MEHEHGVICGGRFTPDDGGPDVPLQALIDQRARDGWRYRGMVPRSAGERTGPYEDEEELEATTVPTAVVIRWDRSEGAAPP